MLGPLERYMTPTLDSALLISSRAGTDIYRKGITAPSALQFELRQSVSTSERLIYHTQAGFDPPFAEGAEFTE